MSDISVLARLFNGAMRNVDLTNNTPVVLSIKVGGVTNTELTKAILDNLVALQNGTDFATGTNAHTHDGRYFTETELGAQTDGASGASKIGVDVTPAFTNFTSGSTVQSSLEGIDTALGLASGTKVKISINDTTSEYLDASLTAGAGLSKSITNPAGNEQLDLAVNVDGSSIEINADALRVKAAGITSAMLAGSIDATKIADGSVTSTEFQYINTLSSNAQDQLDAKVAKAGSAMTSAANITFSGGGEVLGLPATPSVAGAAASKAYVDAVALGLKPKQAVRVASVANVVIASALEAGDIVDGITLAQGDRVLLKDQSLPEQNGIYVAVATAAGAASRSLDMDSLTPIDEVNGAWVPVQEGTQAGRIYVQYGSVVTLGTTAINFEFYNPLASLVGGDMIAVSGSTISVDVAGAGGLESSNPGNAAGQIQVKLDSTTLTKSASGLKVSSLGITNTELATGISALKIADGSVTDVEFQYIGGLTSDAQTQIGTKLTANVAITAATKTKITYDVNGLVTAGADATTADIADSTNKRYVTDADLVDIGNLSGTNTGDQTITLTGDASGTGTGSFAVTVNNAPAIKAPSEVAGEAFSASTLYAVRYGQDAETAGRMYKADKDATTVDNFYIVGLVKTSGALSAADPVPAITKFGSITATSHGFTVGKPLFLSASGALTSTAPTTANHAVVRVGMVKDTNTIDINIQVVGIN